MLYLSIVFLFMFRLSVVVSFSALGNTARNRICRPSYRKLCSTSAPSNGQDSPANKESTAKPDKPVAQDICRVTREYVDNGPSCGERKGQARQNSAGRRVPVVEGSVLREEKKRGGGIRAPPKNALEEFNQEFRQVIRCREFAPAMLLYAKMKENKMHPRESVLTGLLSICQMKEHLASAKEIFQDFLSAGIPPNESAYMALIRCYSDDGQIETALEFIEQMSVGNLEPKLRTYHPVLEAVCKNNDYKSAIQIIKQMQSHDVMPRSEQVTLLLEVSASSGSLNTEEGRAEVDQLLQSASIDLLGMETVEMRRVVSAFCGVSLSDVVEEGILVENREDLPGEVLEISDSSSSSSSSLTVTAMNATFSNAPTAFSDIASNPSTTDSTVPLGHDATNNVAFQPDIYTIASESEALGGRDTMALRHRRARLVDVSQSTCLCPNCGGELVPLLLNEEERKRVRLGLLKIASTTSMTQLKNMQAYGEWLKTHSEFTYIIDGANVAYNHQNFDNGRFSYKQIELVVDKMLARGDGKVLVLLPYSYGQKVVPNSSKQKGRRNLSYVSDKDLRIIQRFDEEGMLYLVPQGADDDWYWIYSTVTEGRSKTAYVVTNDLMRDHRLAFLEPRPFIRWRSTQVINFCFSKAAKEGDSSDPETFIIDPGKYSREIQRSVQMEDEVETERWHIPAADRRAWLCLSTSPSLALEDAVHSTAQELEAQRCDDNISMSSAAPVESLESNSGDGAKGNVDISTFVPMARRKLY